MPAVRRKRQQNWQEHPQEHQSLLLRAGATAGRSPTDERFVSRHNLGYPPPLGRETATAVACGLVPGQARVRPRYPQLGLSKETVRPDALTLRCATS